MLTSKIIRMAEIEIEQALKNVTQRMKQALLKRPEVVCVKEGRRKLTKYFDTLRNNVS